MMIRNLASVICFSVIFLLGGCIDYNEEMWLNDDLSGRAAITVSVREELVQGHTGFERDLSEDGVRKELERIPGVKLVSFQSFRDAGKVIAKITLTFDSVEKLTRPEENVTSSTAVSLLGKINVTEQRGKILFERTLPVMPQTQSDSWGKNLLAQGLGSLFLSNNYLDYKLHVPGELLTSNSLHIDGPAHMIEWRYTLAQAMRDPPVMTAEWKRPFTFARLLLWAGICIVAVLAIFFFYNRQKRRLVSKGAR